MIHVGLIGHPVGHSLSPLMHHAAIQSLKLDAQYQAFDVLPERLEAAVKGMVALGFRGFNVTIPHKEAVMRYLNEVSEEAQGIGAVNTVVIDKQGILYGANTDGLGYLRSLQEETDVDLSGIQAVLLGAGGAARAVGYTLLRAGVAKLCLLNRHRERAEKLAQDLTFQLAKARTRGTITVIAPDLPFDRLRGVIEESRLLINATPVGMFPNTGLMPLEPGLLHEGLVVSDLIYRPRRTRFLQEAEARGSKIHSGIGMFLYQGAEAFQMWFGREAPIDIMKASLDEVQ